MFFVEIEPPAYWMWQRGWFGLVVQRTLKVRYIADGETTFKIPQRGDEQLVSEQHIHNIYESYLYIGIGSFKNENMSLTYSYI